jgi:2-dehydro-3-deoxyphosphooctonate aldolase (KDO 8-P synthase)
MSRQHTRSVSVGSLSVGGGNPLTLIAGPCVIEGEQATYRLAEKLCAMARQAGIPLIFKASYDKANRSALQSFRGPGLRQGLAVLSAIKKDFAVPVLSDVHRFEEIAPAAEVLDIIQIPALLCRQTDLVVEASRTGRAVNLKKGQFLAPADMRHVVEKAASTGNRNILITERGTTFGYANLVVDMRALVLLGELGYPVVFDATHSVQLPGGQGAVSGGDRRFIAPLARAAVAVGIDGIFMEVHENPAAALCDGPNSCALAELPDVLRELNSIHKLCTGQ